MSIRCVQFRLVVGIDGDFETIGVRKGTVRIDQKTFRVVDINDTRHCLRSRQRQGLTAQPNTILQRRIQLDNAGDAQGGLNVGIEIS